MKIRLFKPKTPSNTEISIAVEAFNSPANLCLKGNNLHNRRSPSCGKDTTTGYCLKGRTIVAALINICVGKNNQTE
jgi:hypothetical protein